jgi:hypothetical protein
MARDTPQADGAARLSEVSPPFPLRAVATNRLAAPVGNGGLGWPYCGGAAPGPLQVAAPTRQINVSQPLLLMSLTGPSARKRVIRA